jgi:hypothetical protein
MAKSFKKFRESHEDEWGNHNEERRRKDKRKKSIRQQRRNKAKEKFMTFSEMTKKNN